MLDLILLVLSLVTAVSLGLFFLILLAGWIMDRERRELRRKGGDPTLTH